MWQRAKPLSIVIGIVLGLCLIGAVSGTSAPRKGLPIAVEASSLEELKQALEKATPGSVVRLAAGTYQIFAEDPPFHIKGVQGLPDQPIVIQGTLSSAGTRFRTLNACRQVPSGTIKVMGRSRLAHSKSGVA